MDNSYISPVSLSSKVDENEDEEKWVKEGSLLHIGHSWTKALHLATHTLTISELFTDSPSDYPVSKDPAWKIVQELMEAKVRSDSRSLLPHIPFFVNDSATGSL